MNKVSNCKREIKRKKVKNYKTYRKKHKEDCWQLKTETYFYHNMRYIIFKYQKKDNFKLFFLYNPQAKKQLCYN